MGVTREKNHQTVPFYGIKVNDILGKKHGWRRTGEFPFLLRKVIVRLLHLEGYETLTVSVVHE